MAGIKFDFDISSANLKPKLEEIRASVNNTAKVIQSIGKNFDVSTPQAKIKALQTIINDNESAFKANKKTLEEWQEEARKAFNENDYEGFNSIMKDINDLTEQMKELTEETQMYEDALATVESASKKGGWSETNKQMEQNSSIMVKMLGGQEKYNEIMESMPDGLKKAANGVANLTKAGKAFIATPIGAVIGAITLALAALKTYFNSSAEGQMAFAKVSGYVTGVMNKLKDVVIKVGEYIYKAFTDPKKALEDLWVFLKDQFMVRIQAFGEFWKSFGSMIGSAFKGDWDAVKESAQEMGKSYVEIALGVENATEKIAEFTGEATARLSEEQRKLDIAKKQWAKQEAQIDEQIAKARQKMYSADSTVAEKDKAAAEMQDLITQKYAKKVQLANEELRIAKELAQQSTNSQETLDRIAELEEEINSLYADREREMATITERSSANAKRALEQEQKLNELKAKNVQKEVDLMAEGTKKRLAVALSNYQQEVAEIDRDRTNLEKENGMELTEEQQAEFNNSYYLAWLKFVQEVNKVNAEEIRANNEFLKEYGNFQEKRLAIKQLYEERIANATTEGEKKTLAKQMEQELAVLDVEAGKQTSAIGKLFSDLKKSTSKELEGIAEKGEQALSFITEGEWNEEQAKILGITKEMYDYYKSSPEALESIRKALENVQKAADDCRGPLKNVIQGFKELLEAKDINQADQAIKLMDKGLKELTSATSFLSDSLNDAFGTERMENFTESLNTAMGVLNKTMEGIKTGGQIGGAVGAVVGGAIGLVTSAIGAFNKKQDEKITDRIEAQKEKYKELSVQLEDLQRIADDVYSSDKADVLRQENSLIEQQIDSLVKQKNEELSRKKVNEQTIESYDDQIRALRQQIEDNEEAAVDAIFGSDIGSAIESFLDSYSSAWGSGTSKAQSAKEQVRQMMRDMVKESIKAATESSGAMEQIRQRLTEFYADNVFEPWEQKQIEMMATDLQKQIDEQFGWADNLMTGTESDVQVSSGRSVSTMTQEQASALEGRFTSMQVSTDNMAKSVMENTMVSKQIMNIITADNAILTDIRSNIALSNSYLEDIASYNKMMSKWGDTIKRIADNTDKL